MKLRINGDSLRLRVSRSEVKRFFGGERIEETIHFSSEPGATLTYALQAAADGGGTAVDYKSGNVTVLLSKIHINSWRDASQVGVYASINLGQGTPLELIVEKDFACLDRRDEDNADTFPNPLEGTARR
jgi:hypothetical protein